MRKEPTRLEDFQVPDTKAIEEKLLASIIGDATSISDVMSIVKEEMFADEENKKIWRTILSMYYNHEAINMLTIMPRVNGKHYIDCIACTAPEYSTRAIIELAMALVNTYIKRQAYFTSVEVLQKIGNGEDGESVSSMFDGFSKRVMGGMKDGSAKTAIQVVNELAEELQSGVSTRVATLLPTLDAYTYGGLGGGQLVILAARPSVGKTTIAMQMAQVASRANRKTMVFSLEMTAKELVQRMILSTGYVSPYEIYSHNVNWSNYDRAVSEVINENLIINDSATNINDIRQKIILQCQGGGCDMVLIDYLQLIKGANPRNPLAQQIADYTSVLKQTAKQCGIPIVLLSQLNRSSASEGRSPQLFDLRDSGAIEQDADIVLMLERGKDSLGGVLENTIDMWIRKNRGGRCNFDTPIRLVGNETYSNFTERNEY